MAKWTPERDRGPNSRRRHNVRLYPDFKWKRLPAVAQAYGLTQGEYVEWCVMRDEAALKHKPPNTAAIGRQMLEDARRESRHDR